MRGERPGPQLAEPQRHRHSRSVEMEYEGPADIFEERQLVLPLIAEDEPFVKVVKKLSVYFTDALPLPSTFEQLRTTSAGNSIRSLVDHLVKTVTYPAIVNALLTLKWHFSSLDPDDRGLNETRADACEIVAWRFLSRLSERDAIEYCLHELQPKEDFAAQGRANSGAGQNPVVDEGSRLLPQFRTQDHSTLVVVRPASKREQLIRTITDLGTSMFADDSGNQIEDDPESPFTGLNGLEIAAVANAKKFLSQRLIQKIVTGIWTGEITFWESLNVTTKKKAEFYNKRRADPFSRLRVPKYIKAFEVLFFASFLALYYAVLMERNPYRITPLEILLYVWLTAFAYNELSEFVDAGLFYYTDFWSAWDLAIILNGVAFFLTRAIGILRDDDKTVDVAFDILSLEALFLVPRIFSLLSLHPYFGTLIPCLKQMTKDFVKFMVLVIILYLGFLTTFTLLARETFSVKEMSWTLVKVFFGSSYLGFDMMNRISPLLGPPLMLIFVCLTNILLIPSLISILSSSFSKVQAQSRLEFIYVSSIFVLEASTSNRLTHFYPPLNLIPLLFIRPLRLFISSDRLRSIRIVILKVTHSPIVGAIWLYEAIHERFHGEQFTFGTGGPRSATTTAPSKGLAIRPPMHSPFLPLDSPQGAVFPSVKPRKDKKEGKERKNVSSTDQQSLEAKVEDLTARIAELTALMMAQQRPAADSII